MTKRKRPDTTDSNAKDAFEASYLESVKQTREYMYEDVYEEFTGNPEPQTPPRQVRTEAAARDKAKHEDAKEGIKRPVGRPRKPVQVTDATSIDELEEDLQESSVVEELRTKKRLSDDDILNIAENVIVPFAETLTGCKLFSYQREFAVGVAVATLEGKAKTVTALFARQCIGGDELVVDTDCSIKPMRNHSNAWWTGKKETYRLETVDGHVIENITLDHIVKSRTGWKELRDLEVGSEIAVVSGSPFLPSCGVEWSHIKSLTRNGKLVDVYDTEVPEKGWFDCGGIVCHNSGKSQTVAVIVAGLGILIPTLANVFEAEQFQRFKNGFLVGVYGPDYDKASIVYGRIKDMLSSPTALEIMKDPDLGVDPKDAPRLKFKNGFRVDLRTANKDAKIEGFSYHLIILDEAQDMSAMVIEKSIRPMRNFYAGAVVYIGTPCPERTVFQDTCLRNAATDRANGVEDHIHRLHYEFDYRYVLKARPEYKVSIEEDMEIMGEHSDAFRMAYKLEWLDGKGKFTTQAEFNQTMIRQRKTLKDFKLERGRRVEKEFVLDDVFVGSNKSDTCMFSIDYGGKNDSTVLTIAKVWLDCPIEIGDKYRYNKHIIDFLELLGDDHEEQFPQILAKLNEYNIVAGIDDCTGLGDPVHQRLAAVLRRRGITVHPFIFSQKSKHEGFALLKQELSSGRLTFPGSISATATKKHKNMTRQMLELVRDYNEKTKLNTYKAPDVKDAHDDFPCSIMMLTHLVDVLTLPSLEFTDTSEWQRTKRSVEAQRRYLQYLSKVNAPHNPHLAPSSPRPRMFSGRGVQGKSFEELLEEETKNQ